MNKRILIPLIIILLLLSMVVMGAPTYVNIGPTTEFEGDVGIPVGSDYYIGNDNLNLDDLVSGWNFTHLEDQLFFGELAGIANVKHSKFDATISPTVNDDVDLEYVVGSHWVDITNDKEYICLDNTDGAAVWTETTQAAGGYTNLTSFVDQTAWRVFYSDSLGNITELALGANGTYLGSNGVAVAPTFSVPAGGGDVLKVGTPANSQIGVWTGDGTIEGAASLNYDGANLQLTGDIGATGSRITKGWFANLETTGDLTVNGAALASTYMPIFTGTDTHVTFFDGANSPAGEAGFTYIKGTDTLNVVNLACTSVTGALTGNADTVTGFTPASGSLTLAGADVLTITTSAATDVTLPITGTLATLSGVELLSNKNLTDVDTLNFADFAELTIATGAITITQSYHKIDTETDGATDNLTTISGGTAGDVIYLCAENDARTVVLKHDDTAGAGKIITSDGNDYSLDDDNKVVQLVYNSVDSHWHMVGAAGGGAGETNTASNIGWTSDATEAKIYKQKTGVDLELRTLKEGTAIAFTIISGGGLQENNTQTNQIEDLYHPYKFGEYWTAQASYVIDYIQVEIHRLGAGNTATMYVYAADVDGYPTGNVLGSTEVDLTGVTTDGGGEWVTFDLSADSISITSGQKYVWYLYSSSSDTNNCSRIHQQTTDVLANAHYVKYYTGWTKNTGMDWTFKIYSTLSYYNYIQIGVVPSDIRLDDLKATEDNTDLNASTTAHGLMPKLPFSGDLLSTTTVAFNADADTTLYTVPAGKRCVLSHAIVVAAGDAGATTTVSIGQNTAETDFVPANTLSNLDAQYDSVILQPIPNTTPLKIKSYAAATVIEAQVASQSGAAGNTIYLFGITY